MQKKKSKNVFKTIVTVLIVLAIAGLGYSVYAYYQAGAQQGIVVCNPQNPTECVWQAHIHTFVVPVVCGEERRLPIEVGELEETHTHEEKSAFHWHDRVPFDKEKQEILDKTPLMIGTAFQQINSRLTSTCLLDKCNGDLCADGTVGTLKMFVKRGDTWQQNFEFENFVWQDQDIIYLAFDSRTAGEVLQFLETSGIRFPVVGVG